MDEQIKRQIAERLGDYLDELEKATKIGAEFTAEQAPLLLKELISWGIWSNVAIAFIFATFAVPLGVLAVKMILGGWREKSYYEKDAYYVPGGFALVAATLCTIAALVNAYDAILPIVAPRVYLLQQLKELAR